MTKTPQQIKDYIRHVQDELAYEIKSAGIRGDLTKVNNLYGQISALEDTYNFIFGDE